MHHSQSCQGFEQADQLSVPKPELGYIPLHYFSDCSCTLVGDQIIIGKILSFVLKDVGKK